MIVFLNNEPITLPYEPMSVSDLLSWKNISQQGSAIAINNKLIRKDAWSTTLLNENMHITVISAAFGG